MSEQEFKNMSADEFLRMVNSKPQSEKIPDPRAIHLPPMNQQRPQQRQSHEAPRQNRNYPTSGSEVNKASKHLSKRALFAIIGGCLVVGGVSYEGNLFGLQDWVSAAAADISNAPPVVDHGSGVDTGDLSYRGEVSLSMPTSSNIEGSCMAEDAAILYGSFSGHMPVIPNIPLKATADNPKPTAQPIPRYLTGKNGAVNVSSDEAKPVDPKTDPTNVEGNLLYQIENDKTLSVVQRTAETKVVKDFWAKSDNGYLEVTINDVPLALHVCESGTGSAITTTHDKYGNVTGISVNRANLTLNFMAPPVRSFLSQTDGVEDAVNRLQPKLGQYETIPASSYNLFLKSDTSPYNSTELDNLFTAYSANNSKDYASELFVQMEINAVQQLAAERNNPVMFAGSANLQDMVDNAISKVLAKGGVTVSFNGGNYKFAAGDASSVVNKANLSATTPKGISLQDLSMEGQPDTKIFEFDSNPKLQYGYFVQPKIPPTQAPTSTPKPTTTPKQ